jgi:hypothetical protein
MKSIQVNNKKYVVKEHKHLDSGHMLLTEEGKTFIVFKSKSEAGSSSKTFWKSLASKNPYVFLEALGGGNYATAGAILLKWSLGEKAGPGEGKIKSLKEWFDLLDKEPHYGKEEKCELSTDLINDLKLPRFAVCYDPEVQ